MPTYHFHDQMNTACSLVSPSTKEKENMLCGMYLTQPLLIILIRMRFTPSGSDQMTLCGQKRLIGSLLKKSYP